MGTRLTASCVQASVEPPGTVTERRQLVVESEVNEVVPEGLVMLVRLPAIVGMGALDTGEGPGGELLGDVVGAGIRSRGENLARGDKGVPDATEREQRADHQHQDNRLNAPFVTCLPFLALPQQCPYRNRLGCRDCKGESCSAGSRPDPAQTIPALAKLK